MSDKECLHQCKRCGMVYSCNAARCGQPFESGQCQLCSAPAAASFIAVPS